MSLLAHPGRTHVADLMSASKTRPNVACVAGMGAKQTTLHLLFNFFKKTNSSKKHVQNETLPHM
jgi:hypothetical protein